MFMPELTRQLHMSVLREAEACYRAFLLCGRGRQILQETPGLGITIPLFFVQCECSHMEATGLVVAGALDPAMPEEGFDLDGQFRLFSTDHLDAGEFITVNGWIGAITILARRQGACFILHSSKGP